MGGRIEVTRPGLLLRTSKLMGPFAKFRASLLARLRMESISAGLGRTELIGVSLPQTKHFGSEFIASTLMLA